MRFVVFGILDMRWKYRKMVKPQERLFMQSKRLHKESFLWNDLFHDKNKSEPIANRRKVRIYSLWQITLTVIQIPPTALRSSLSQVLFNLSRSISTISLSSQSMAQQILTRTWSCFHVAVNLICYLSQHIP